MTSRVGVAVLAWLTMSASLMGLGNLIEPGPWQGHLIMMPLLIAASMAAVAWPTASRWPVVAGVGSLLAGGLTWLGYLTGLASRGQGFLPTPDALRGVGESLTEAVANLYAYARPASNPDLFLPLGLVGLGPVCVIALFLAIPLERPLWLGVPALGCWAVFLGGAPGQGLGWLLASSAAYLLLMAVAPRAGRPAGRRPGRPRLMAAPVVAVAVAVGLVASSVAPAAPGWGRVADWLTIWTGAYSDQTGISLEGPVDVGAQQRAQSSVQLFRSKGDYTGPLKVGSLDRFWDNVWMANGAWTQGYEQGSVIGGYPVSQGPGTICECEGDPTDDPTNCQCQDIPGPTPSDIPPGWNESGTVDVEVGNLAGPALATGAGPRTVTMPGAEIEYDPSRDSLMRSDRPLAPGDAYQTRTWSFDRTDLAARTALPMEWWRWEETWSLLEPGQSSMGHSAELRDLTLGIIGDATSLDGALTAIQAYLRAAPFRYTLHPMWHSTSDPVWDFLTYKEGYCVQFATAMALMGMSVGIQMRVSMGYLPGSVGADGWRTVRGAQAHMWPEAYLGDMGWVPYEPTPSVDAAVVLHNTPGAASTSATPSASPTARPTASPGARPTTGPGANQPTGPDWGSPAPWLTVAGIGAALLLAGLAGWLYIRSYTPERAWRSIRRRGVRAGVLTDAMSVRSAVAALTRRDPARAEKLAALRDHLERSRYGPAGEDPARIPGRDLWKLRTGIRRGLAAGGGDPSADSGIG